MQPYKKQLLRRNAWYRQQLQMQLANHSARQHQPTQPAACSEAANKQSTSGHN